MKITETELLDMVDAGQTSHHEFQEELPDDDGLARVLSAFANTRGGWLIVGADEEGTIHGCRNPKDAMSRIRLVVEEDIKPALNIAMNSVRTKDGILLAVRVNTSDDRPHSIPTPKRKREIVVRVGILNETADGASLNALRSHRTQGQPKDALEAKILEWIAHREAEAMDEAGNATPEAFGQAANVGTRRASKAFISLERSGLLIGFGGRSRRFYALP